MTYHFRKIRQNEVIDYIKLKGRVYPRFVTPEKDMGNAVRTYMRMLDDDKVFPIGAFNEDGRLVGRILIFDYLMNFRGREIRMGGIGGVGIDLPNKKQHICRDMLKFSLNFLQDIGITCSGLHPFRPDFYKNMGYGTLTPFYRYHIDTTRLKRYDEAVEVTWLEDNEQDITDMTTCFNEYYKKTNGEIKRRAAWSIVQVQNEKNFVVGYRKDGVLKAYAICSPIETGRDNFMQYDLNVDEFISLSLEGTKAILGFLRNQADQFDNVVLYTQDETFYHLFDNPGDVRRSILPHANHSFATASTGLMFRVLNPKDFVAAYSQMREIKGEAITCTFEIDEPFLDLNETTLNLKITEEDFCLSESESDLTVKLSMAEFSAMIFGSVSLESLARYGLATYSDYKLMKKCSAFLMNCEKPKYHAKF
ncbi:MAG TPA: GNAT family N-acetyltransferase [Thermotogota bacterium]|nr:GNAT family N-acetyltransferase [Thermotogota bacterium]HPJ89463.1 GNAT family N-acetyltransferase [Thermotogota bacterium]HPR96349.1 GNAT family N-acetyltransferase [Thermotogota bacterium]